MRCKWWENIVQVHMYCICVIIRWEIEIREKMKKMVLSPSCSSTSTNPSEKYMKEKSYKIKKTIEKPNLHDQDSILHITIPTGPLKLRKFFLHHWHNTNWNLQMVQISRVQLGQQLPMRCSLVPPWSHWVLASLNGNKYVQTVYELNVAHANHLAQETACHCHWSQECIGICMGSYPWG